jgi:hypothetical protein
MAELASCAASGEEHGLAVPAALAAKPAIGMVVPLAERRIDRPGTHKYSEHPLVIRHSTLSLTVGGETMRSRPARSAEGTRSGLEQRPLVEPVGDLAGLIREAQLDPGWPDRSARSATMEKPRLHFRGHRGELRVGVRKVVVHGPDRHASSAGGGGDLAGPAGSVQGDGGNGQGA